MADVHLTINAEEREYLVRLLESASKGDRVEIHHTDTRAYKEQIKRELALVETLLAKLKQGQ